MKHITTIQKTTTTIIITVAGLCTALGAHAVTVTQVASFDQENESTRLLKHYGVLYAMNTTDDTLKVYRASTDLSSWTEVTENKQFNKLSSHNEDTGPIRIFKGYIYITTVNDERNAEIWRAPLIKKHKSRWHEVGEVVLGDAQLDEFSALISDLKPYPRKRQKTENALYAFGTSDSGAVLFKSEHGTDWTQVGDGGLGENIDTVTAASKMRINDHDYVYIGTNDGTVYRSKRSNMESWTEVDYLGERITSMRMYQNVIYLGVSVVHDSDPDKVVATVMKTEDGETFEQLGDSGLGNTDNSEVAKFFFSIGWKLHAATTNETDGAEIRKWNEEDETWEVIGNEGFDNANNDSVVTVIPYRGEKYFSTTNNTSGSEVYVLEKDEEVGEEDGE